MTGLGEPPVREGQVLEGKFRVERMIGEGAMGLVVEATHLALDERVALKFLRQEGRARPDVAARFAREARAAVKLKSDHVARVFDVGSTEDGTPFIVMEYLQGSDLGSLLEIRRQLDIQEAVEYIIHACEGLTEAHARGIVHRDIKPENLFLAQGAGALKQIKILDFGISKATLGTSLETESSPNTAIMGSPHYMSPDQIRNTADVDARADIWSLGIVLFELISGRMPFTATDVKTLVGQIQHEPHQRLTALRPDVPRELEAVIDRCLEKDLTRRYEGAADLAVALLPFAPRRARAIVEKAADIARSSGRAGFLPDLDSLPPPTPPLATTTTNTALGATVAPTPVPPRRNGPGVVVWLIAGFVVLLGLGAGAFAILNSSNTGARGAAVPTAAASLSTIVPGGQGGGWASIPSDTNTNTNPTPVPTDSSTAGGGTTALPSRSAAPARTFRAPPPAVTTAKAPPPPRSPESDIRLER